MVCVAPVLSVARTRSVCRPGAASQSQRHCRQVSSPPAAASLAWCQGPLSVLTSTAAMPLWGAQATPATVTGPALIWASGLGTSIRDSVLIGAWAA